jgi:hypothetical protein
VLGEPNRRILRARIGVADQLVGADGVPIMVALPQGHPQRVHDQLGCFRRRRVPGDDPLGEAVDDERDVDDCRPAADVAEVADPLLVRRGGAPVPIEQVTRAHAVLARDCGADLLRPTDASMAKDSHAPGDRALSHVRQPGATQKRGQLPPAIQAFRGEPQNAVFVAWPADGADRVDDLRIGHGAHRRAAGLPLSIGPRGSRAALLGQHPAHRPRPRDLVRAWCR